MSNMVKDEFKKMLKSSEWMDEYSKANAIEKVKWFLC